MEIIIIIIKNNRENKMREDGRGKISMIEMGKKRSRERN